MPLPAGTIIKHDRAWGQDISHDPAYTVVLNPDDAHNGARWICGGQPADSSNICWQPELRNDGHVISYVIDEADVPEHVWLALAKINAELLKGENT